jgi:poly-gamma-glutamate synthesis protein (capsule biosynthesis protein)
MELFEAHRFVADVPCDLPALRWRKRDPEPDSVRVCAVGDTGFSGRALTTAQRQGFSRLLAEVRAVLEAADITFGNLEVPLAHETGDGQLCASTDGAMALRDAGFNLVHLANNHIGDYGQPGLAATLQAVEDARLQPLGAGGSMSAARQLVRTDFKGLRVGWLGCGRTLLPQAGDGQCYWEFDEEELTDSVRRARASVDVLIVSIHIGLMYISYPRPEHKTMAERLMAAGADAILMHHAHVLQGVQVSSQGAVCCYNLGNFLYDWEVGNVKVSVVLEEQNEGAIFLFDVDAKGVSAFTVLPTWIDEDCCVRWARGNRGLKILNRLAQISKDLETDFSEAFERQRAMRNTGGIVRVLAFHARRGHWRYVGDSLRRLRWEHFKMAARWVAALVPTHDK